MNTIQAWSQNLSGRFKVAVLGLLSFVVATCVVLPLKSVSPTVFFLRVSLLFVPTLLILLHFVFATTEIWRFVDRNRFLLSLLILAFAVVFKLSGTSIGVWNSIIQNDFAEAPVFGTPRVIRSDEFMCFTPMAAAQSWAKPSYPYFNDILRATPTDMFSVYAQPVKHPLLLFRPFLSGFLLFGFDRGLAFFWVARFLALFLVSYELLKLVTDGKKALAGVGASLITFAPAVQWWGAINAFAEIVIFGSLFVVSLNRFLRSDSPHRQILYIAMIFYSAVAYVFTLYPPHMVSMAYAFLPLSMWTIARYRHDFRATSLTWFCIAVAILASVSCLMWYLSISSEAFQTVAQTHYPGTRVDCGGTIRSKFGSWWANPIFPYGGFAIEDSNVVESAVFPDFFPLGFLLSAFLFYRRKIKDSLIAFLAIGWVFQAAYCAVGFPKWLALSSFLGRSMPKRAIVGMSFIGLLILVRALSAMKEAPTLRKTAIAALGCSAVASLSAHLAFPSYLSPVRLAAIALFAFMSSVMILRFESWTQTSSLFLVLTALLVGAFVNPIQRADGGVSKSPLFRAIRKLAEESPGIWLVDSDKAGMNQYPLLCGAATINGGNIYPQFRLWNELDPHGKSKKEWNRYVSKLFVRLVDSDSLPSIIHTDDQTVKVMMHPESLGRLGVKYVLTNRNLDELEPAIIGKEPIARVGDWNIYYIREESNSD